LSVKNILKVEELVFERNDSPLFHPVNFLVGCGEALHVEGANGSGKTTLFQLLTGLLQPSQGSILFCGRPFEQCKYEYFSDLLYIGHQPAVKAMLSVRENLQWMSPANTSSVQIVSALVAVGLQDYAHIPCHKLSAGQQRRVALARLITSKANLWYLDEPLAALDKQGVDFVENCMQQHTEKGGSIVFSSHQDLAKMPARKLRINRYCEVD
jgi:heme exporter protein A